MKLAHLSDLHIVSLAGAVPFRLLNKRITGYANLKLARAHHHRMEVGQRVAAELLRHRPDHVIITGDVTNLALETEFEAVQAFVAQNLGLPAEEVSIVPGNHDVYTRGAQRTGRFARMLAEHVTTDVPAGRRPIGATFPFVRLRGPVALIGLCTAVARPPLVAAGVLGPAQRERLADILAHPEVRSRAVVVLQHHPLERAASPIKQWLEGLRDAEEERRILESLPSGLLVHGHLHRRMQRNVTTSAGLVRCIGATSATLDHASPDRRAGFNLYEFGADGGECTVRAFRLTQDASAVEEADLPDRPRRPTDGEGARRTPSHGW